MLHHHNRRGGRVTSLGVTWCYSLLWILPLTAGRPIEYQKANFETIFLEDFGDAISLGHSEQTNCTIKANLPCTIRTFDGECDVDRQTDPRGWPGTPRNVSIRHQAEPHKDKPECWNRLTITWKIPYDSSSLLLQGFQLQIWGDAVSVCVHFNLSEAKWEIDDILEQVTFRYDDVLVPSGVYIVFLESEPSPPPNLRKGVPDPFTNVKVTIPKTFRDKKDCVERKTTTLAPTPPPTPPPITKPTVPREITPAAVSSPDWTSGHAWGMTAVSGFALLGVAVFVTIVTTRHCVKTRMTRRANDMTGYTGYPGFSHPPSESSQQPDGAPLIRPTVEMPHNTPSDIVSSDISRILRDINRNGDPRVASEIGTSVTGITEDLHFINVDSQTYPTTIPSNGNTTMTSGYQS